MEVYSRGGIINILEEDRINRDTFYLLDNIIEFFDQIIIVANGEVIQNINYKLRCSDKYRFIIRSEKIINPFILINKCREVLLSQFEEIIIFNDSFFGPIFSWEKMFQIMQESKSDIWGIIEQKQYINQYDEIIHDSLDSCFLGLRKKLYFSKEFVEILSRKDLTKLSSNDIIDYFKTLGFTWDAYIKPLKFQSKDPQYNFDLLKYIPYELINKYECPILSKRVFDDTKLQSLFYHLGNQSSKAVEYIKNNTEFEEDNIYEYLLDKNNISSIRQCLNLTYICGDQFQNKNISDYYQKTVIAIHMYYEDLIDECLEYIDIVPKEIMILVTVKNEYIQKSIIDKFEREGRKKYKVLVAGKKGRDLGALLLVLKPYLIMYEYICFLHDKKTTGGSGYPIVGDAFMKLAWENLLHGKNYIDNILNILVTERRIGLLAPPIPYHSGYVRLLGDAWTICYEETYKLAEKLGVDIKIDKELHPFALSTCFWFKKDALKPLLEYNFTVDDFPDEPMPTDGTISHALERIVIYIAQSQKYMSGIVSCQEYAQLNLTNYEYLLGKDVSCFVRTFGQQSITDMFSGHYFSNRMKLLKFVVLNKKVCIYGQGNNGKVIAAFFEEQQLEVEYFIVSDGMSISRQCYGYEAFYLSEKLEDRNKVGVVIAVDKKYRNEVVYNLQNVKWDNYFVLE